MQTLNSVSPITRIREQSQGALQVKIMQKLLAAAPSMPPMVALGVAQKITRGE